MGFVQEIKDIARFEVILNTLLKHELGYYVDKLHLAKHLPLKKRIEREIFKEKDTRPEHIRRVLEELGGTFVKLGQLLSLRPDLIPSEYCDEFRKLQDSVAPFSGEVAKKIIAKELGKPVGRLFKSFEDKPIASASVSQVHIAYLKNGRKVAVKVQRPGLKELFDTDIDIMKHLAVLFDKRFPDSVIDAREIVKEFLHYTKQELDFLNEAKNIEEFHKNYAKSKKIMIPQVYWNYCSGKVVTMEYLEGKKLDTIKTRQAVDKIIANIVDSEFDQIFKYGIFHADPHEGNLFICKDHKVGLIDFGIVGRIHDDLRREIIDLTYAVVERDVEKIAQSLYDMGFVKEDTHLLILEHDIRRELAQYYEARLEDIKISEVFNKIIDVAKKNNIRLPSDLVLLIKAIMTIEGVVAKLDPKFKVMDALKPKIEKAIREKYFSSKSLYKGGMYLVQEYGDFIKAFPKSLLNVMQRIAQGKIEVDMDNTDVHRLTIEMDRSSNRISYGLVIAALLISASIIVYVDKGPKYMDIPILALIGYLMAGLMGIMLVNSISREGKYR